MLGRWTCKIHCASYIYFASHPGLTNLTRESATRQSALQSLESNLGKREHPSAHACGPLTARDEGIWTVDGSLLGSLVGLPSPPPSPPLCPQKPCSLVPLPSPQRASFCPTRNLRPRSWLLVSKLTQGPASCLRLVRCLQLGAPLARDSGQLLARSSRVLQHTTGQQSRPVAAVCMAVSVCQARQKRRRRRRAVLATCCGARSAVLPPPLKQHALRCSQKPDCMLRRYAEAGTAVPLRPSEGAFGHPCLGQ